MNAKCHTEQTKMLLTHVGTMGFVLRTTLLNALRYSNKDLKDFLNKYEQNIAL